MSRSDNPYRRGDDGSSLARRSTYGTHPTAGGPAREWPSPDGEADELHRLVSILARKKHHILIIALLVVLPAGGYNLLAERLYRSVALVQIDPGPVQVLPYREIEQGAATSDYEMFLKGQEQVLKGATLQARVAKRLGSDAEPALAAELARLHERFSVQRLENTQMFRLGYLAGTPELAARVANTYAEEFIKQHFESRQEMREKARQLLQRELDALEQRVQSSERTLVGYAQQHGIPVAEPDKGLVQQRLSALSGQVTTAEADVAAARSKLESLRGASVENFPERLITSLISGLVGRLAQLEQELNVLRASFGVNWPSVVQKRSEIALVRTQLESEKTKTLAQAREQAWLDYTAAEAKRRLLAAAMAEQAEQSNQLETASIEYNIIRREVDTNRKMYEGMLERLKQTSVTAGMEFGGLRIVEPAVPEAQVYSPRPWWNLLLAAVLGLALGICVVVALDFWDTSVSTVEQVEHITVVPVLAALPWNRPGGGPRHLLSHARRRLGGRRLPATRARDDEQEAALPASPRRSAPDPIAAEGLRNLCASILLSRSARPPRLLMVTSAVPGEGKTTLVEDLGRAFAETGARTLLVECDMRRPRLAASLGVDGDGGLSLFLSGHVGPTPAIQPTDHGNLFVVAAGPTPPNPPMLLGSEKMRAFLQQMAGSYQMVILDVPPALPMADARVLASMVEGVVLVVRSGHVSKAIVRRVSDLLEGAGGRLIGAVLNDADPAASATDYRYYREYYTA